MKTTDTASIFKIMWVISKNDMQDQIWWNIAGKGDDEEVRFFANTSDLFYWACADLEEITIDKLDLFLSAIKDTEEACGGGIAYAPELYAARVRQMRPQGAAYPEEKELWPLFDACGPEREVGGGNPHQHPKDRQEKT